MQTWAGLCAGLGCDESLGQEERALYSAGPDAVLDLIHGIDDEVQTLFVVGHNPTMSVLAMTLDDGSTPVLLESSGFPPAAAAVFTVDGAWAQVQLQGATAIDFHVADG